jgi:hypothetical protein
MATDQAENARVVWKIPSHFFEPRQHDTKLLDRNISLSAPADPPLMLVQTTPNRNHPELAGQLAGIVELYVNFTIIGDNREHIYTIPEIDFTRGTAVASARAASIGNAEIQTPQEMVETTHL